MNICFDFFFFSPTFWPCGPEVLGLFSLWISLFSFAFFAFPLYYGGVCYNKQFLSIKSGCYNEHTCHYERGGILSANVARPCAWRRAFPLWLERQSSPLLSFVRFSYQFSSVICLFIQCIKLLILYYFYTYIFDFVLYFSCLNGCVGW